MGDRKASPTENCLILFTRYPEVGNAKTRLIPALGATAAAEIHRQLTEHSIAQIRRLRADFPVTVQVQFVGGDRTQMQSWLGGDLDYRSQASGDLGDRMAAAFQQSFAAGFGQVVLMGSDCPQLDADLLTQAFQCLPPHDLVLGPATDGGYYLIGLRRPIPELFREIAWSTEVVLAQTIAIAEQWGLKTALLPTLSDIDTPADLPLWYEIQPRAALPMISMILPVLDEAAHLGRTLAALQSAEFAEIIVVDGGSQDDTVALAQQAGVMVLVTQPGRAHQMNLGARKAQGEILLFLHGDTQLPPGGDRLICQALNQPGVVAAAFNLAIDGTLPGLRWVEWGVRWRSRLFQLPYGDQGLGLKKSLFWELGGFPTVPIMEDFLLVKQLQKRGRIAIAPAAVLTSARRWQKLGVIRTTLINQMILLGYFLGLPLKILVGWYRRRS